MAGKIEIKIRINHQGEVNRARYMPQNEYIVATKSISSDVYVFDITKHPSSPEDGSGCNPDYICKGHEMEGYGLSWNPHRAYNLLSGSDDGIVCLWDLENAGKIVQPTGTYKAHTDVIEDVDWHQFHPHIFGSVGDDKRLMMYAVQTFFFYDHMHVAGIHVNLQSLNRPPTCLLMTRKSIVFRLVHPVNFCSYQVLPTRYLSHTMHLHNIC